MYDSDVRLMLPNGKKGGYSNRDIEKLKSKGPNSPLVRLYNTYVRATRDLSDAERAAPFCHNITFPSGEEEENDTSSDTDSSDSADSSDTDSSDSADSSDDNSDSADSSDDSSDIMTIVTIAVIIHDLLFR